MAMGNRVSATAVSKTTDQQLIARIQQKDEQALDALYQRYGRLIYSIARHMVGDPATAEEITLDVFTQVWTKAHTYRQGRAQVNTWLTSMARNRAIDELRRRSTRIEKQAVSWADVHQEPATTQGNPVTAVQKSQEQERILAALHTLPEEQKQVLAYAYFGSYTHQEIAAMLNLPLGTVKTRIRLGMQKLRGILKD